MKKQINEGGIEMCKHNSNFRYVEIMKRKDNSRLFIFR